MQQINKNHGQGEDYDILSVGLTSYTLLITEDSASAPEDGSHIITVRSAEEAARYLVLLGDTCSLHLSQEYRLEHPEMEKQIRELACVLQAPDTRLDSRVAAEMMRKLPFDLKGLLRSPIALSPGSPPGSKISKALVHKTSESNILISEPCLKGNIWHFNMSLETDEMHFDHESAHVQGMLMIEALRQVGISVGHLQGLPLDGQIALLSYNMGFFHFVERSSPIIIRAYSSFTADRKSEDKEIPVYAQVIQWGRVCAEAMLIGFAFMSESSCVVKEARIEKIAARQKTHFESRLMQLQQMENNRACA
ncbi:MAG: hypothetical protein HGA60_02580 [Chlorobiaceae bacterium]|nr:hypothetical protein [Chlorobiaceae bacterium]